MTTERAPEWYQEESPYVQYITMRAGLGPDFQGIVQVTVYHQEGDPEPLFVFSIDADLAIGCANGFREEGERAIALEPFPGLHDPPADT